MTATDRALAQELTPSCALDSPARCGRDRSRARSIKSIFDRLFAVLVAPARCFVWLLEDGSSRFQWIDDR
jgi:hypothetical protein